MSDAVVVGAGVIGLSTARRLQQAGMQVTLISADPPEQTVSWVAAAVWYPTRTHGDDRVLTWARRTFEEFTAQARDGVPGVTMRSTRMLLRGRTDTPWWAGAVPDFRIVPAQSAALAVPGRSAALAVPGRSPAPARLAGPAAAYTGEWHFTVPAVEMGPYLTWLLAQFTQAGGVLLHHRLKHLSQAGHLTGAPIVVNATGLASGHLVPDPRVHPIRGRIVLVTNPGWTTSVRDEDDPAGVTYVHPRSSDIVLGGTFEPFQRDLSDDATASRAILERCTALVPELADAQVIGHRGGLRPGRDGGARVELDRRPATTGDGVGVGRLIHNYGHGGAGVTLSWGCADEVTALVTAA